MIKNIHFRLTIIVISVLFLGTVFMSGYWLTEGRTSLFWHIMWVGMFVFSLILHAMLRKKRLGKMFKEALQKESSNGKYNYHTLLESLSQRRINELSQSLQLDKQVIQELFAALKIEVKSFQETLNNIAKNNDYNEQKLFVMMMELHLQNKIKKEKNGISANKFR
jgi:hypothetical protein